MEWKDKGSEMKKSVKAALWSGFVFPGVGHFFLKCYLRGMVLFIPAILAVFLLTRDLVAQTELVMSKLESGAVSPDLQAIGALLDATPDTLTTTIAYWVIVVCWVLGVIDAYRLGSMQDKAHSANDKMK
jgi:hypothetical protein